MKPGSPSQHQGAQHEEAAANFLEQQGLSIVARNFHCKMGELDIIAAGKNLHFVEVRYRASNRYGSAAASVTKAKQRRIQRSAEVFLQRHPRFRNHRAQFDVMAISGTNYPPKMDWIESAF